MIMDKNGKLFGRINIIDLFVVLAVIAVVAGVFIRFSGAWKIDYEPVKIRYVVKVENIRTYTVDALEKGGVITDDKKNDILGDIIDVKPDNMEFTSANYQGKLVKSDMPQRYMALVTIEAAAKKSDSGYILSDNQELYIGHTYNISSKYVYTTGTVESIEEIENLSDTASTANN